MKKPLRLFQQLFCLCLLTASTTSFGQQWRLVKQIKQIDTPSTSGWYYRTIDSFAYEYGFMSGRGSSQYNDSIDYDKMVRYIYSMNGLRPYDRGEKVYNTNNDLIAEQHERYNPTGKIWELFSKDSLFYANNKVMKSDLHMKQSNGVVELESSQAYLYNSNGDLTFSELSVLVLGVGFEVVQRQHYKYNSNNKRIEDSSSYNYTGIWEPQFVIKRQFNTANKITQQDIYSAVTATNLVLGDRRFYYYNTQGLLNLDSVQTNYPNSLPQRNAAVNTYKYNSNSQLTKRNYVEMNISTTTRVDSQEVTISYTNFGKIDEIVTFRYGSNNTIVSRERRKYYYESYWPVSVSHMSTSSNDNFKLFPNPATETVSITWLSAKASIVKGRIVNMQGQVVQQWEDEIAGEYRKDLLVNSLSPGNYYIEMESDKGKVQQQLVIVK